MAQEESDLQRIKELIEIMKGNDLVELEIKHGDDKIFLKRSEPQQPTIAGVPIVSPGVPVAAAAPNSVQLSQAETRPAAELRPEEELVEIKSPLVGTFYAAPSPDSEPYVEIGSSVDSQTVVCIIEAMKVMNEIKAETSGSVVEILVNNGQAVEYGQVLFRIRPD
ncbi:MAG: acetyl-CoA carboxylase biotin carboxyl carrier protein [Planctomycetota bacterium]|jgi:acetyl-CoA carboxylase biotin carboxyl carrier protein